MVGGGEGGRKKRKKKHSNPDSGLAAYGVGGGRVHISPRGRCGGVRWRWRAYYISIRPPSDGDNVIGIYTRVRFKRNLLVVAEKYVCTRGDALRAKRLFRFFSPSPYLCLRLTPSLLFFPSLLSYLSLSVCPHLIPTVRNRCSVFKHAVGLIYSINSLLTQCVPSSPASTCITRCHYINN